MISVGIRKLRQQISVLIRYVRESGNIVEITYHGKVVAQIIPVTIEEDFATEQKAWENLDVLAERIGKSCPEEVSVSQSISEVRR